MNFVRITTSGGCVANVAAPPAIAPANSVSPVLISLPGARVPCTEYLVIKL